MERRPGGAAASSSATRPLIPCVRHPLAASSPVNSTPHAALFQPAKLLALAGAVPLPSGLHPDPRNSMLHPAAGDTHVLWFQSNAGEADSAVGPGRLLAVGLPLLTSLVTALFVCQHCCRHRLQPLGQARRRRFVRKLPVHSSPPIWKSSENNSRTVPVLPATGFHLYTSK